MKSRTAKQEQGSKTRRARGRIRTLVTGHPRASAIVVASAVALGIFGFLWFRPDKLFVNKTVSEALPSATVTQSAPAQSAPAQSAPASAPPASAPPVAAVPQVLSSGPFRSLEHDTKGTARLVQLADGRKFIRLEDFRTSNGPDVIVILSETPATEDEWSAYDDGEFVAVGALKGNVGNQNYEIPGTVDLSKYRSVVIWCRRFNVAFGAAPIELKA